jgi:hypothetical protein
MNLAAYAPAIERLSEATTTPPADRRHLKELAKLLTGEQFLTTGDAATRLAVTPNTVKAWIETGLLPGARWAESRWQIPLEAVIELEEKFADANRRNAQRDFMPAYSKGRRTRRAF